MSDLDAKVSTEYRLEGKAQGDDGFSVEFLCDDSFKSWRQIVRWNMHYRHWRALRLNARDLFTKVIRRKLKWQLS